MERVAGIEPALSAWKAEVLPLNYTRAFLNLALWWRGKDSNLRRRKPADLQSAPFGRSGTPPADDSSTNPGQLHEPSIFAYHQWEVNGLF